MERSPEQIIASLDKPGAGIAWYYRLINHALVAPLIANNTSWASAQARFLDVNADLERAVAGLSEAQVTRRVLVRPLVGLEDSSRYWSIAMTLQHLNIVGPKMADTVVRLSRGEAIADRVDIAAVKPSAERDASQSIAEYSAFAAGVLKEIDAKAGDRRAATTLPHPWFGQLTARGWLWLLGTHTWVHLRQVREIRKGV